MIAKTIDEFVSLFKLKLLVGKPKQLTTQGGSIGYCYRVLVEVSRSFALVIQELPQELRDAVCVFYLVLRGLDTVEDDPNMEKEKKLEIIRRFDSDLDLPEGFNVPNCGHRDYYKRLMENFTIVCEVFRSLRSEYRTVIKDITRRMGDGMIEFLEREVETVKDYDLYCHYVAGLVGYGLTDLFLASGREKATEIMNATANSMGCFLQKTNIIRDYWEDIREDRVFWPREIWSNYASTIEDFKYEENFRRGVQCINHLVTDALKLIPDCLIYMKSLQDGQIFNFCAIPQVMAIATLAEVYNNEECFRRLVKIRKGMAAKLIYYTQSYDDLRRVFNYFIKKIENKVDSQDPNAKETKTLCHQVIALTNDAGEMPEGCGILSTLFFSSIALGATSFGAYYLYRRQSSKS